MLIEISYDDKGNKKTKIVYDDGSISVKHDSGSNVTNIGSQFDKETKIATVLNSKIYLPNYKVDLIQGCIARGTYFDLNHLKKMSKYLNEDSVVIDCGANIGNHTLYFANECNVRKIYAFEPVPTTYKILQKNIKLNNLENVVEAKNIGLSNEISKGAIESYNLSNIGGTRLCKMDNGDIDFLTIDSLNIKEKIDLIKIDVEGMDYLVLQGAENTIRKNMPVINIESFESEYKQSKVFLSELGYELAEELSICEYIYIPAKNKKS